MKSFALETKRLYLREWCDQGLEPFARINADPAVMKHLPKRMTREESDLFAARIRKHFADHGFGWWAVEEKDGEPFIGFVGVVIPRFEAHFTPAFDIGWRLASQSWGRGLATEAATAAVDYAFERWDAITSHTVSENLASRRVMEKLGMSHDPADNFEHPLLPEGHPLRSQLLYRLTRSEWGQRKLES